MKYLVSILHRIPMTKETEKVANLRIAYPFKLK